MDKMAMITILFPWIIVAFQWIIILLIMLNWKRTIDLLGRHLSDTMSVLNLNEKLINEIQKWEKDTPGSVDSLRKAHPQSSSAE